MITFWLIFAVTVAGLIASICAYWIGWKDGNRSKRCLACEKIGLDVIARQMEAAKSPIKYTFTYGSSAAPSVDVYRKEKP